MTRTHAFFLEEATDCLRIARDELEREIPDRRVFHRAVRRLRGSAQLAQYTEVARRAATLEMRAKPAPGDEQWSPALATEAKTELKALEAALEGVRNGEIQPGEETRMAMEGEESAGVVGIEELEYRGAAALERAAELRQALEDAIVAEAPVGPILDELFDLVRLGMK